MLDAVFYVSIQRELGSTSTQFIINNTGQTICGWSVLLGEQILLYRDRILRLLWDKQLILSIFGQTRVWRSVILWVAHPPRLEKCELRVILGTCYPTVYMGKHRTRQQYNRFRYKTDPCSSLWNSDQVRSL